MRRRTVFELGRVVGRRVAPFFNSVSDQLPRLKPLIKDGHVGANCNFILAGAPQWPFAWKDGLVVGMVWPCSPGELICHLVEPSNLPFRRATARRAMQWLVANEAL